MKQTQDLDRLLSNAREIPPELSLSELNNLINTFPPTPPSPRWSDFITTKTKWIMFTTLLVSCLATLLFFNDSATLESPPSLTSFEVSITPVSEHPDELITLTPQVKPSKIVSETPLVVDDQKNVVAISTPDAQIPRTRGIGRPVERLDILAAEEVNIIAPAANLTAETFGDSVKGPVKTSEVTVEPKTIDKNNLDNGNFSQAEIRILEQTDQGSATAPWKYANGSKDTTLLGEFTDMEIKGWAKVYIQKGDVNSVTINYKSGHRHSTSIKETQTDDGGHRVKISVEPKGVLKEAVYDIRVTTTNLERLKLSKEVEAFYLNELGTIEVTGGQLRPLISTDISLTDRVAKNMSPFKWGVGSSRKIVRRVPLDPFKKVIVKDNVRVVIRKNSGVFKAQVMSSTEAAKYVDFKVAKGILTISLQRGAPKNTIFDVQLTASQLEEIVVRSKSCVYLYNDLGPVKIIGKTCLTRNFEQGWVD